MGFSISPSSAAVSSRGLNRIWSCFVTRLMRDAVRYENEAVSCLRAWCLGLLVKLMDFSKGLLMSYMVQLQVNDSDNTSDITETHSCRCFVEHKSCHYHYVAHIFLLLFGT